MMVPYSLVARLKSADLIVVHIVNPIVAILIVVIYMQRVVTDRSMADDAQEFRRSVPH